MTKSVRGQRCQLQTGLPFSSRRTRVSVPFTTSRARMRSASPCLTFEPVRVISSPLLKLTPMSSRKDLGQRYTSTVSVPVFNSKWATSFSLPFGGSFTSSTVPFIFVSAWTSYLGGLGSCGFCATRGRVQRSATAGKISFQMPRDGLVSLERPMAPPSCGEDRIKPYWHGAIVLHFQHILEIPNPKSGDFSLPWKTQKTKTRFPHSHRPGYDC